MKQTVGDAVKVKAAGGIRTPEAMFAMIGAGAERIGLNLNAEAVKAAVEALDYEALMAEVPTKATQQEVQHTMSAEFNLSPYGRMFEKN